MGTRADFYIGVTKDAEWLGSIAWDGYPDGIPDAIMLATDKDKYKAAVDEFVKSRDDGTTPNMGWPWPWDNSFLTDCVYTLHDGKVLMLDDDGWYNRAKSVFDEEEQEWTHKYLYPPECPDMSSRRDKIPFGGPRSGLIVVQNNQIVKKEIRVKQDILKQIDAKIELASKQFEDQDYGAAHKTEDEIFVLALEAIANGAENTKKIASLALTTWKKYAKAHRWYE